MPNERRLVDGRVELVDLTRVEASPLYNHDLAPVPLSRRNWSTYNYAALWVSMAHCIPTYMLASGLLAAGMNWSQALVMTALLLGWAIDRANGLGPLLAQPGKFRTFREFWPVFVPSLTAMIGFWATLSLNMPDFTRFGRSQREQIVGQIVALPTTMSVFAAMGVMITSATAIIYGQAIWDPVQLVGTFTSPMVVAVSMFTVVVATVAVNIA